MWLLSESALYEHPSLKLGDREIETMTGRQWITKYRNKGKENEKLWGKKKKVSIKWRREQGGVGPMYRYTWQGDYSLECGSGHMLYLPALVLCVLWGVWCHPRTYTTKNSHSQTCPSTTFRFITSAHSLSKITLPRAESSHSRQDVTQIFPL